MGKRILYIVPHRLKRSPGQRFRCEQFIPFLQQNGFDITYSNMLSKWDDKYFYQQGQYAIKFFIFIKTFIHRCYDVIRAKQYDCIFIYREAFMIGTTLFERGLKLSKRPIIFDFDDSIWIKDISKGNQNLAWMKRPSKTDEIITLSDLVIVGNQYLANHAKLFCNNVSIVPTTIDTDYHKPVCSKNYHKDTICIGWTGSETTIRHLEMIIPVLKKIKNKYGDKVSFTQISNVALPDFQIGLKSIKWTIENEIEELQKFDIGIMPLPNDEWSQGKCGFKGLQYMAMEIPTVMSPVGVNKDIIDDGKNGFFATTSDEWFSILCKLIDSENLREDIGKEGRKIVVEQYSTTSQMQKYLQLFHELTEKR